MTALPPHAAFVAALEARLRRPLPGFEAHARMAPFPARADPRVLSVEGKPDARQAAVLILLYPHATTAETTFVLTVRHADLRDHSGQVSLPGGRIEGGETEGSRRETPEVAALREAEEEVGVPASAPRVLGRLTPLYVPPSRFAVWPIVAALDAAPRFAVHEDEVAALVECPLATLLDPAAYGAAPRQTHVGPFDVPVFRVGGQEVWGATAMLLAELAAVAASLDTA